MIEYSVGESLPFGPPKAEMVEPKAYPNAPANTAITVRFDRVMDIPSVIASLRITANGENVQGATEVQEGGRSYRFHPDSDFPAGATVRIFLLPTAMDTDGRNVVPYISIQLASFVVAGGTNTLAVARRGFDSTSPADAVLEVEFDSDLDAAFVNEESVWLRKGSRLVPGRVSLRDNRVVQFTPDAPLEAGVEYVLTAGAVLRAVDGREFVGQDLRFRATEPEDAAEVESVEATEWQGRTAVRVRFTRPVSALAASGFRAERDGREAAADTLLSTDGREVWIVSREPENRGELTITMSRVPSRNGRILPARRLTHGRSR